MYVTGKVIEVGKQECAPPGSNGNEAVIEIVKGQLVRVSGVSDTVLRFLAGNLFQTVTIGFESSGRES